MLYIVPRRPKPVIERKRKVFVEQNFHDTSATAGGRCAAT
jgi:hypothetical protein